MLATERDDSALLPGMFRLAVSSPDEPQPIEVTIGGPFGLIGRDESCACRLNHPDVSRRHAYLQAIFGRVFCVDLGSRNGTHWGDTAKKSGWLDPNVPIRTGPYQIRVLDTIGLGSPSAPFPENFSPLDPYAGQLGQLPRVEIEVLSNAVPSAEMTVTRLITLVGSSARCKLRLQHPSVAKVDCSLVWLPDGLWVMDLSGRGHSRLRGKVLRCARLENEQTLRLGRFHLRVHYLSGMMSLPAAQSLGPAFLAGSNQNPSPAAGDDELPVARTTPADGQLDRPEIAGANQFSGDSPSEAEREALASERQPLAALRQASEARERALDAREAKLSEAQGRLASEWEQLHVDRAAYEALAVDFARRQEEFAARLRRFAEDSESLGRQRIELANRNHELAEIKQRLAVEWQRIAAQRPPDPAGNPPAEYFQTPVYVPFADEPIPIPDPGPIPEPGMAELAAPPLDLGISRDVSPAEFSGGRFPSEGEGPTVAAGSSYETPSEFDVLESLRHNKVFSADRAGTTLVVMPMGDASEFHYGDVHVESNKVRRLLEGGSFQNLLIDLGHAPVYSAVTINVIVALSRIASNRGGRAVLCRASPKTRSLLQTMKLLDVWPLFEDREQALQALSAPFPS
jgi:anti-anti-sigma regulatory factor